jgi:hypothetical protein
MPLDFMNFLCNAYSQAAHSKLWDDFGVLHDLRPEGINTRILSTSGQHGSFHQIFRPRANIWPAYCSNVPLPADGTYFIIGKHASAQNSLQAPGTHFFGSYGRQVTSCPSPQENGC